MCWCRLSNTLKAWGANSFKEELKGNCCMGEPEPGIEKATKLTLGMAGIAILFMLWLLIIDIHWFLPLI